MVDLCWDIADGVIFYLRPPHEIKNIVSRMQSKKKIDVSCQIITAVSEDTEMAAQRAKTTLAFYVAVGAVYRNLKRVPPYATHATEFSFYPLR